MKGILPRLARWAFLTGVFAGVSSGAVAGDTPGRPNVRIFLIDDLGRSDFGFDGSPFHDTPWMDAFARSGVRFTDFYSAHPVCSPTRAALMTGKAPQWVGITDFIPPGSEVSLPAAETTLGESDASLIGRTLAWYYPHTHGSGHRPFSRPI